MKTANFKIVRSDGLDSYAAYLAGTINGDKDVIIECDAGTAIILLNVQAVFDDSLMQYEDGSPAYPPEDRKRHIIMALMHEFGHALEDHYDLEFDEHWIEKSVESWKSKKPDVG